jgi:hypothetical protein
MTTNITKVSIISLRIMSLNIMTVIITLQMQIIEQSKRGSSRLLPYPHILHGMAQKASNKHSSLL